MAQRSTEELLEDILRALSPPSGGGGSGGGGGAASLGLSDFTSALQSPRGAISGLKSATAHMGKFAGPAGLAADAAAKLYEYMDGMLGQFKEFNQAGFAATGGMLGLEHALAGGRLSMSDFMKAVQGSEDVLASMGSNGAKHLGEMNKALIESEKSQGLFALSNSQAASYIFDNIKQQKAYNVFDKMSKLEQQTSNRTYINDLNKYSKILGISTDSLSAKLNKTAASTTGMGTQLELVNQGLSAQQAANTTKNLNMVMAGLGPLGDAFNTHLSTFLAMGRMDTDSAIGKMYQTIPGVQDAFDEVRDKLTSGAIGTEEGMKQLSNIFLSGEFATDLAGGAVDFRRRFDDATYNTYLSYLEAIQKAQQVPVGGVPQEFWDVQVNNLNRWFEGVWTSGKQQTALLFQSPREFLTQYLGKDWANWFVDSTIAGGENISKMMINVNDFMSGYFGKDLWGVISGTMPLTAIWGKGADIISELKGKTPSWENLARSIFPEWFSDYLFDTTASNPSDIKLPGTESIPAIGATPSITSPQVLPSPSSSSYSSESVSAPANSGFTVEQFNQLISAIHEGTSVQLQTAAATARTADNTKESARLNA